MRDEISQQQRRADRERRRPAGFADVADASGIGALSLQADVSNEEQVAHMVEATIGRFGRLDFLVNCAGNAAFAPVAELSRSR